MGCTAAWNAAISTSLTSSTPFWFTALSSTSSSNFFQASLYSSVAVLAHSDTMDFCSSENLFHTLEAMTTISGMRVCSSKQ